MDEDDFVQEEYVPNKETYTESIKFNDKPFTISNANVEETTTFVEETPKKAVKRVIIEEASPEIIEEKYVKKVSHKKKSAVKKHVPKKQPRKEDSAKKKDPISEHNKFVESQDDDSIKINFDFFKKFKHMFGKNNNGADKKMKKSKNKLNSIITLIVLFAIIGLSVFILNLDKIFPDKGAPLAIINDQIITTKDVEQTLKTVPPMYKSLLNADEILNQTIINSLLLQEAGKLGLSATQDEVENAIDKTLAAAEMSKNDFKLYLAEQNLTYEDMQEFYKTNLIIEQLLQKTAYVGINVTQKDINSFYKNNSAEINATLDEVSDQIEQLLIQQAKADAFSKYISDLIQSSSIRIISQEQPQAAVLGNFTSGDVEKYAKCATENKLDKNSVIFIYSESCPHCQRMKPIVTELETEEYKFKWASVSDSAIKPILSNCYSDVLAGGVPQFICARTGQTIVGEQAKETLKSFAQSCNS